MAKVLSADVVVPAADRLGEGVIWDEGALRWIDLLSPRLQCWQDGQHRVTALAIDPPLGAIARGPVPGALWLIHASGLSPLDATTGVIGPLRLTPEPARAGTALNDAKVAPDGALWFGSYDLAEKDPRGALWRLDPGGRLDLVDTGFVVANGPAFAADGTAYFNASLEQMTLAYRRGPQGRWKREVLIRHDAPPDGLTVDAEGTLWIALYSGGAVTRHAPDGQRIGLVGLPCPNVTACAFGGPGLTTLYITTAREGTDPALHPEAGHLFAVETGTTGRMEPRFIPR